MRLFGYFEEEHRGGHHLFIVFESLGRSLFEFIRANNYLGFPMHYVRMFGYQLLQAVACTKMNMWDQKNSAVAS